MNGCSAPNCAFSLLKGDHLFLFPRTRKGIVDGKSTVDVIAEHSTKYSRLCEAKSKYICAYRHQRVIDSTFRADPKNVRRGGGGGQVLTIFSNKTTINLFVTSRLNCQRTKGVAFTTTKCKKK